MTKTEERARLFATMHHKSQPYGDQQYVVHLTDVNRVLVDAGITDDILLEASWLHDVVEDTPATCEDIKREFGVIVAAIVWAVTGVGKNRKERNKSAHEKIAAYGSEAVTLKLADRIANVERSKNDLPRLTMYVNEWPVFKRLREHGGDATLWSRLSQLMEST